MNRRIYSFIFAFSLFIVVGYFYGLASANQSNQNMNHSDKNIVSSMAQEQQQEPQPQQPEGDKHCERPNPDGTNPDVGGTDKSKIGCGCVRKCVNGRPTEDYQNGVQCKVHCKPDNCDCPNPCVKT